MLYNRCTGICKFGNNAYPRRIRRRLNLGHIFRGKRCVLRAGKYGISQLPQNSLAIQAGGTDGTVTETRLEAAPTERQLIHVKHPLHFINDQLFFLNRSHPDMFVLVLKIKISQNTSVLLSICKLATSFDYTGCPRRKGPNFGRVFLRSNYTDITQNTYIQSSMVTEILAREV